MIVSKKLKIGELIMRIITGTILMVSLMMPVAVIADVTHKASGNVTITKYKEGDEFRIVWAVRKQNGTRVVVSEMMLDDAQDGDNSFVITCDPMQSEESTCQNFESNTALIQVYTISDKGSKLLSTGEESISF